MRHLRPLLVFTPMFLAAGGCPHHSGSISGTVLSPYGVPVTGAYVLAMNVKTGVDSIERDFRPDGVARSGKDGAFRLEGLEPGTYAATATAPGHAAAYAPDLTVGSGAPSHVELQMGAGGRNVAGVVRDGDGHPVGDVDVWALRWSDLAGDVFATKSARDGRFSMSLPKASYTLLASGGALRSSLSIASPDADLDVELTLLPPPEGPPPAEVVAWLRGHAVALATAESGQGWRDLEPLREFVGDARIVALGEATHGSREFFQLKHRMLEFLVEEMGFSVFAIEASLPDAIAVDDYVMKGEGDPAKALADLGFWTWNTEEVLEMIRWMRRHNEDPNTRVKVRFRGFDMQAPWASLERLVAYFRRVDPDRAPAIFAALDALGSRSGAGAYAELPEDARARVRAALDDADRILVEMKEPYVSRSSLADWELAARLVRLLRQAESTFTAPRETAPRDRFMAENARWILEHEPAGTRMVLWAHNGHVSTDVRAMGGDAMGLHLRRAFGKELVVFGFSFDRGAFQAYEREQGVHPFTVGSARPESLDAALQSVGAPLLAIDFRGAPSDGTVGRWMKIPRPMRSIGAVFGEGMEAQHYVEVCPGVSFDAVLFVASTTSARPNAAPTASNPVTHPPRALSTAPGNLDFEKGDAGQEPPEWYVPRGPVAGGYRVALVEESAPQGGSMVRLDREGPRTKDAEFGNVMQAVDASAYRGKKVRFRALVRAEVEGANSVQLWMRVDREGGAHGFFDNMQDRPIVSPEWKSYEVTGEVASDARVLNFGAILVGAGRAWIDDAALEVVD